MKMKMRTKLPKLTATGTRRVLGVALLLFASGCMSIEVTHRQQRAETVHAPDAQALVRQLLGVDEAFSRMSAERGVAEAFAAHWAREGVLLATNEPLLRGRDAVMEHFAKAPSSGVLTWRPLAAQVARSGELGYTYGTYEYRSKNDAGQEETRRGKYVTIWRKEVDGSWKIVLDGGNPGPAESQ